MSYELEFHSNSYISSKSSSTFSFVIISVVVSFKFCQYSLEKMNSFS